ncbi:glycosyltransferase family 2 protein [Olivibacter ginsenosidimutans]|uniref:Glycosyltransferase family 2 protein n=1 Tax=Olivibacter ginsenosidimutans TaxID=1176537 RepID=A0ABP9AH63_9SPHI
MISIITTIHNQLAMNRLFYKYITKYTDLPYELIIIDNNSTDGSAEFFEDKGVTVIKNPHNYSYPYTQNQGIKIAKGQYLAFLNNDLIVSKDWASRILAIMQQKQIEIASFASNDFLERQYFKNYIQRRWKYIKYSLRPIIGTGYLSLKLMNFLMYGNWERFTEKRYRKFGYQTLEGFSGPCIIMTEEAINKVGLWDERIQEADFDLYFRTKMRKLSNNDIQPVQTALGIYFHHYQRLTLKSKPRPFADAKNIIPLKDKWGKQINWLLKDIGSYT